MERHHGKAPKGFHRMPDGSLMKGEEMKPGKGKKQKQALRGGY